jgi:hypothetical protein
MQFFLQSAVRRVSKDVPLAIAGASISGMLICLKDAGGHLWELAVTGKFHMPVADASHDVLQSVSALKSIYDRCGTFALWRGQVRWKRVAWTPAA